MTIGVKIDLTKALSRLSGITEGMIQRANNPQPILQERAEALDDLIDRSFTQKESPLGKKWAPPKPSTVLRAKGGSLMVRTGRLKRGSTAFATKTGIAFRIFGKASEYGWFHVFGAPRLPQRSFFPVDSMGKTSFATGPAAAWFAETKDAVIRYIVHGKGAASVAMGGRTMLGAPTHQGGGR